jgi:transposase-like protein
MIYAATPAEIAARRKAFLRKWRLKCKPVADSLEEAGDRLFTFTRLPPSQWRSARTTNAIERLHEEFERRIKTQTVLPSADTAAMLFWALLGNFSNRRVRTRTHGGVGGEGPRGSPPIPINRRSITACLIRKPSQSQILHAFTSAPNTPT